MGAGASASQVAVQKATPEEVKAAFDALEPDQQARVKEAMAAAQAAGGEAAGGEATSSETAPEKAEKAATEAAPAEAAPKPQEAEDLAKSAPYLAEYFAKAQARTEALIGDQERLMAIAMDPEAQKKIKEESQEWFKTEARPLLEKSFKHHDYRTSDTLDPEEAGKFFQHMISAETQLAKAMSALAIEAGIKMSMQMLENMLGPEERIELKAQIEAQIQKAIEVAKAEVQKKEDNYMANKAENDKAAFKVLDRNGDGTIQLQEFLAAFEPETERNVELHLALGYLTQEEIEQQKMMEEAKEQCQVQ